MPALLSTEALLTQKAKGLLHQYPLSMQQQCRKLSSGH